MVDIDSRAVLFDALTRVDALSGEPRGGWVPEQRIGLADALHAYTVSSARAIGRADELGTLERGKLADIAVFERNLFELDADELKRAHVRMTFVGGKPVFSERDVFS